MSNDIETLGLNWSETLIGSNQRIIDTNYVRLNMTWKESTASNGNNKVHVRFYVASKYRISGIWNCSIEIGGVRVATSLPDVWDPNTGTWINRIDLSQGDMSNAWSTSVLAIEGSRELSRSTNSIGIKLLIHDFDYQSVTTGNWTKKDFSQDFSLSLTNTAIIPNNPNISINTPDDGQGRSNYEVLQLNGNGIGGTFRVYPCQTSSGSGTANKLQFYIGMPGGGSHSRIRIGKYVNGQGWNDNFYDSGWQATTYHKYNKSFYSGDRYDSGVAWKVWSMVKSSTGNEKSSEVIYFVFNDQPHFSSNEPNISCSSIIVPGTSNFKVNWNSSVNGLYQSVYTLRYKTTDSSTWNEVYTGATTSATIDLSNQSVYPRGKTIQFQVRAQDKYDADTDFRGLANVVINRLPTLSSSTITNNMSDPNSYNNHYDTNVTFILPSKADSDGQSTFYKIYYKVGTNDWVTYNSNYTGGQSLTINCSSYQNVAGGTFQLKTIVNDGLEDGDIALSAVLKKNKKPEAPSGIRYSPSDAIHLNTHAEVINSISWNKVNNFCNGRPVSSYEVVKKSSTSSTGSGTVKAHYAPPVNTTSTDITDITRGEYFWFEVIAVDLFGYRSDIYSTPRYRRNRIPSTSSSITLNQNKLNVYKTVPLIWDNSVDPDGDIVKYKLEVKKGTASYQLVSNEITSTSYTHNISGYAEGLRLKYRVTPFDDHNVYGESTETTQNIVVNTRPLGVNLSYPINIIYNKQPRLFLDVLNDVDNDDLTLTVNINGVNFESNTNQDNFSKSSYRPQTKVVFHGPQLNIGQNIIKTKSHDGYQYSDEKTFTITINDSLIPVINTGDTILNEHMVNLNTMINNCYNAYGCSFNKKNVNTSIGSNVSAIHINNMYDNINLINQTMNNFSSDSAFDKNLSNVSASLEGKILKEINSINTLLKNL